MPVIKVLKACASFMAWSGNNQELKLCVLVFEFCMVFEVRRQLLDERQKNGLL